MNAFYCKRFITARVIADSILFPIVVIGSYGLKFKLGWAFNNWFNLQLGTLYNSAQIEPYLSGIVYLFIIWGTSFYYGGVYRYHQSIMAEVDETVSIIKGSTLALVLMMALTFVTPFIPGSRFVLFYMWVLSIILFSLSHYVIYRVQLYYYQLGKCVKKVIVIGGDTIAQDIVEQLLTIPSLALHYCGTYCEEIPNKIHFTIKDQFKWLGTLETMMNNFETMNADIIFISQPIEKSLKDQLIADCNKKKITLNSVNKESVYPTTQVTIKDIGGIAYRSYHPLKKWGWQRYGKRIVDIIIASGGLIVLMPLLAGIAVWIKAVSYHGAVVYRQNRVGQQGKIFSFYKFRTMVPNAEDKTGPVFVSEEKDHRYIKGGHFLRRYSLDELPQFINILKGEMSVVGPRPERPFFVAQFSETIPYYEQRHRVKGGVTGWAQINGRSELTRNPAHKTQYDLFYIKNWTLVWDIKIILKTILMVIKGENAY
jgi:exopolysaccharide biosynthesis polyprenyl glycosylphosphotransferase